MSAVASWQPKTLTHEQGCSRRLANVGSYDFIYCSSAVHVFRIGVGSSWPHGEFLACLAVVLKLIKFVQRDHKRLVLLDTIVHMDLKGNVIFLHFLGVGVVSRLREAHQPVPVLDGRDSASIVTYRAQGCEHHSQNL